MWFVCFLNNFAWSVGWKSDHICQFKEYSYSKDFRTGTFNMMDINYVVPSELQVFRFKPEFRFLRQVHVFSCNENAVICINFQPILGRCSSNDLLFHILLHDSGFFQAIDLQLCTFNWWNLLSNKSISNMPYVSKM